MKNRVAVRANWDQVVDRIDLIFNAYAGDLSQVVNVDEVLPKLSPFLLEIEFADLTVAAVVLDAGSSSRGVSFVSVDGYLNHRSLTKQLTTDLSW